MQISDTEGQGHRRREREREERKSARGVSGWRCGTNTYRLTLCTKYQRQQQPPCNKTRVWALCGEDPGRWRGADSTRLVHPRLLKQACPQSWPLLRSTYKASGSSRKRQVDTGSLKKKQTNKQKTTLWDYTSQQPL